MLMGGRSLGPVNGTVGTLSIRTARGRQESGDSYTHTVYRPAASLHFRLFDEEVNIGCYDCDTACLYSGAPLSDQTRPTVSAPAEWSIN